jgi:hypothetical protein
MAKQVVLERLNKLVAKGYVVRWGQSDQDTLRLEHARAPDLTLFSDRRVWILTLSPDDWTAAEDDDARRRFQSFVSPNNWIATEDEADDRRFKSFVARVPRPTILQSLRGRFAELWLKVLIWTLVVFFGALVAFLVTRTWRVG